MLGTTSCIQHIELNAKQAGDVITFYPEKELFGLKGRKVWTFDVFDRSDPADFDEATIYWSISEKSYEKGFITGNPPRLKVIRYGETPEGFIETVKAKPLECGVEYYAWIRGPGHGGDLKFILRKNSKNEIMAEQIK